MEEVSSSLRTGEEEEAALRQLMQFAVQWIDFEAYGGRWTRKKEKGISTVVGDSEDNTPVSLNFWANFFSPLPLKITTNRNATSTGHGTVNVLFGIYISFCFFFVFFL